MSERPASGSEGESDRSSSPDRVSEEGEEWYRSPSINWEYTLSGRLRAVRPEGPVHFPVRVYLVRRDSENNDVIDSTAEVNQGDTIFDLEWRLGLHRSGITSGRLSCPPSREDLIARGVDPRRAGTGSRIFMQHDLRVEDLHGYFWENQVFSISFV